jgi:hypothetical protein
MHLLRCEYRTDRVYRVAGTSRKIRAATDQDTELRGAHCLNGRDLKKL